MPELVVSVNHVAALRRQPNDPHPDPAAVAVLAELAGAAGIAVRFTADRRFVNDRDVRVLREIVQGRFVLGMPPSSEMMGMALDVKPDEVVLIPDRPDEATPDGGLDLVLDHADIRDTIATLRDSGIPVFLLTDPDPEHIKLAHRLDVDGVQIHTAAYAGHATARAVGQMPEVEACIVGHSIMARALLVGIDTAVREMIILLEGP